MLKKLLLISLTMALFSGCASVLMEEADISDKAKQFNPPSNGMAGLYIYRSGSLGGALKKDVWVDGTCIGETAPDVFFYEEVAGNADHKVSTESEFSPNDLMINTETGKNYFVEQYIKFGVFVGGAGVKQVGEDEGKRVVSQLEMAKKGKCSQ